MPGKDFGPRVRAVGAPGFGPAARGAAHELRSAPAARLASDDLPTHPYSPDFAPILEQFEGGSDGFNVCAELKREHGRSRSGRRPKPFEQRLIQLPRPLA